MTKTRKRKSPKRKWTPRQHEALAMRHLREAADIMRLPRPIDRRWLVRLIDAMEMVSRGGVRVTAKTIAAAAEHLARQDAKLYLERFRSQPKPG